MRKSLILAAGVSALTLAACGPDRSREDAHDVNRTCNPSSLLGHCVDKDPPRSIAFNNNYSNVETKCDGYGHRIYVTTAKRIIVLPDPTCPGFVRGQEPSTVVGAG